MVLKDKLILSLLAFTLAAFGFVDSASAASKHKAVSREQAWKLCKAQLNKDKIPGNLTTNDRYLRGGACMHGYGYRL